MPPLLILQSIKDTYGGEVRRARSICELSLVPELATKKLKVQMSGQTFLKTSVLINLLNLEEDERITKKCGLQEVRANSQDVRECIWRC